MLRVACIVLSTEATGKQSAIPKAYYRALLKMSLPSDAVLYHLVKMVRVKLVKDCL